MSYSPLIKKLVIARWRLLQKICRVVEPSTTGYIYKIVPAPNVQRTLQKRVWKDCKRQMVRDFAVRVNLLVTLDVTMPQHELNKTIDPLRWVGEAHKASTLRKEL